MIGKAGSDVKVSCKVPVAVAPPSRRVSVSGKLPSLVGVPEIRPVVEFKLRPGGNVVEVTVASEVTPLARIWNLNG
jgi:hypothetical protein